MVMQMWRLKYERNGGNLHLCLPIRMFPYYVKEVAYKADDTWQCTVMSREERE